MGHRGGGSGGQEPIEGMLGARSDARVSRVDGDGVEGSPGGQRHAVRPSERRGARLGGDLEERRAGRTLEEPPGAVPVYRHTDYDRQAQ